MTEGVIGGSAPLRVCCPAVLTALRTVRRRVQRWAHEHGLPDDVLIDLQLAVGEAVPNGVEHAYRAGMRGRGGAADPVAADPVIDVDLELRAGLRGLVVAACVTDRGRWRPVPADPGGRGRGLTLISRLARKLRVRCSELGTRVSFEIPVPAGPGSEGAAGSGYRSAGDQAPADSAAPTGPQAG